MQRILDASCGSGEKQNNKTMNMKDEIIQRAIDLTEDYEARYYNEIDDVNWVEKDGESLDGSYCDDCIDKALYKERRDYLLEQRKLPIEQRDSPFSKFGKTYNYGGGYESDWFNTCDICGKNLDISILPDEQELEGLIDDLEYGELDDCLGWKINSILYNAWDKDDKDHKGCYELSVKLAQRTVEILEKQNNQ